MAQNTVFVNNEWVDVYQIMARAQQAESETQEIVTKQAIPTAEVGILSRTLFSSPMHNLILPAKILHKSIANIVLIGEDAVQLKDIGEHGQFTHIASKTDFNGRILAAKVFGDLCELHTPCRTWSPRPTEQAMNRRQDLLESNEGHNIPPDVIVLTLTSRTLMFLWSQMTPTGIVSFSQRTVRLPASVPDFDTFGTLLAVDPKRRAIAVAAHGGRFILYKTKTMQAWREETARGNETIPIEDERIISVEGRIMHMDFISSPFGPDDFYVVLLFIVAHHGKTKITCFDWDCRQDLSKATVRTERVAVDIEDHNPSLLIPLRRNADFLLVFDTHISVYSEVLSGVPVRNRIIIDQQILDPIYPGDSKSRPRWVAWDRPFRSADSEKQVLYIAREDGRVIKVDQNSPGSICIEEKLECPSRIDTAFAYLSAYSDSTFPETHPEMLITAGGGSDSFLRKLQELKNDWSDSDITQPEFFDSMPNWSPLTDLSVKQLSSARPLYERKSAAMLVTGGIHPHGEISELRYGVRASIEDCFSGMSGCTSLWIVDYGTQLLEHAVDYERIERHCATFIMTTPLESLVINIDCIREVFEGTKSAFHHGRWNKNQIPSGDDPVVDHIMRDEETLSACCWSEQFSIQITRKEARILQRSTLLRTDAMLFDNPILMAVTKPAYPFIVIAFHESRNKYVEVIPVLPNGKFDIARKNRIQLTHDPTCIELFDVDGSPYIFVSSYDSKLALFMVNPLDNAVVALQGYLGDAQSLETQMLCESAVLLTSGARRVLVCTTRNGFLLHTDLSFLTQVDSNFNWTSIQMGIASARVSQSLTDLSAAFVSCGSEFCTIRCAAKEHADLKIDSVWFAYGKDPSYCQSAVTAMCQLPHKSQYSVEGRLEGMLFAVSGDYLLFTKLDSDIVMARHDIATIDAIPVPRKLSTQAKPTKILYVESLRKILVSTIETREAKAPPNGCRALHSTLKLLNICGNTPLDLMEDSNKPNLGRILVAQYKLDRAERVYSMVEWPFIDHHGKRYSLIIIGTGVQELPGREIGRRLIFNTGKTGTRLQLQKESVYEYPVYCIALWSNESTVSVSGKTLSLDCFDSQAGRWFKRGKEELQSPGLHISVQPPFVYVSTLKHSHICFKIVKSAAEGQFEFVQIFTDSRERSCTHHLVLDLPLAAGQEELSAAHRIVLITDKKSASITGLHHHPERTYKNAADTVFEAHLPRTVIRLQRGDVRPPWRRSVGATGQITGVFADDIIGACWDGTLYTFSLLSQPAQRLLSLVQNLIQVKQTRDPARQHTPITPVIPGLSHVLMSGVQTAEEKITARSVDPREREYGAGKPRNRHVDGDLLVRWREEAEGGLVGGGESGDGSQDGDLMKLICEGTHQNVQTLFLTLAGEVDLSWVGEMNEMEMTDVVRCVEKWMGDVLRPVL